MEKQGTDLANTRFLQILRFLNRTIWCDRCSRRNVTETLTPKIGNKELLQNYLLGTVSNELLGGGGGGVKLVLGAQPHPQFLKWYKTHDKTTNSQNTLRTYGQHSEQLFTKKWPFSNPYRNNNTMNMLGETSQKL